MRAPPPYLDQLDEHLTALPAESDAMILSELDGFLTGILICPGPVAVEEWLPAVWGDPETAPVLGADELQRLVGLIMQHHNALARSLQSGRFEPYFEVDSRHDDILWELWISGFARALELRPHSWVEVLDSDDGTVTEAASGLMKLVALKEGSKDLSDDERRAAEEMTEKAPDLIREWIGVLNAHRLAQSGSGTPSLQKSKLGRNDPCPCGSGRKFKKCCGST